MGPRDPKGSADTNGNGHSAGSGHSAGKGKAATTIPRTSSNDSLRDMTPEMVDTGIAAIREICRILSFAQTYQNEIDVVQSIYGLNMSQKKQIEDLETMVNNLTFRKNEEMDRLRDENEVYQANAYQLERERKEVEREQAAMSQTRQAIQSDMERQKEKGINDAKQEFLDKHKTKIKQMKEEFEKRMKAVEMERDRLKDDIKELEEKNIQTQKDMNQQKKDFELEKRSFQSHIERVESELHSINAASIMSPQPPKIYIESFRHLWELIRDVAVHDFQFLPEETKPLDSDEVRNQLFTASPIFRYHPLSSESNVSTFLRGCAIQDFLSRKTISMIRRQYFVEPAPAIIHKSGTQTMDTILDTISNVPVANSSQELSWRLTTVDKLDRFSSHSPLTKVTISTKPDQGNIVKEIWDQLHHFQSSPNQQLDAKLSEIASTTIRLWDALRKDSCQVDFEYDPSTSDWQGWEFVDDVVTNGYVVAKSPSGIPSAQLPSKPFVLFPRITGSFSDSAGPRVLHIGLALSHESLTFQEGLQEIEHIDNATKELRKMRRGSSAQSSPVIGKRQGDWPVPHRGFN